MKVLKTIGKYTIYDTESLDTDSQQTNRSGHIEIVCKGVYCLKGSLPKYAREELARIAEKRGLKFFYNNGSYFDYPYSLHK